MAVDGNSLFHRAYHAYEGTGLMGAGRPRWAVYGFMALLAGICDISGADGVVVAFDGEGDSVRKAMYPPYKEGRAEKPEALVSQLAEIEVLLGELGVNVICQDGLEADDVVAAVSKACERSGVRCTIATSDRDAFCLISENTTVLRLVSGLANAVAMTPDVLVEKVGVRPEQYLDYAALRGDKSDNLDGVNGIGEKTAARILSVMGSVEAALCDLERVERDCGKAAARRLGADGAREIVERNKRIMTPVTDIEVDLLAAVPTKGPHEVRDVLVRWELGRLYGRVFKAIGKAGVRESFGPQYVGAGAYEDEAPF